MEKEITIIVNGREKIIGKKEELSFSDVIALAFESTPNENTIFTVTYRRGHGDKPEGILVVGDVTKVKEGMIFNVTATDKS